MTTENLKLIIDALNTLGAGTKEAFYWWLLVNYGFSYLIGLLWSIIGGWVLWRGIKLGEAALVGGTQMEGIKDAAGIRGYLSDREYRQIKEVLEKHYTERA